MVIMNYWLPFKKNAEDEHCSLEVHYGVPVVDDAPLLDAGGEIHQSGAEMVKIKASTMYYLKAVNFVHHSEDWHNAMVIINDVFHRFPVHDDVNITNAVMYSLDNILLLKFGMLGLACVVLFERDCRKVVASKDDVVTFSDILSSQDLHQAKVKMKL